jgi:Flp pilus assembly CpaF family ATPase
MPPRTYPRRASTLFISGRSGHGGHPCLGVRRFTRLARSLHLGFGPLQPLLEDPTVEEIWINDPTRVFVARRGRHELTNLVLTRAQVDELVERMLKSSGRRVDISRPFVETKDDYGISTTSRVAMSSIAQPIGQFGGPQVRRNSSAMLDSRNHQAA